MTLIALHYLRSKVRPVHLGLMAGVLVLAIPVFNVYRHVSDVRLIVSEGTEALSSEGTWTFLLQHSMSRFYGIDSVVLIIRDTPTVMDFQYGKTVVPFLVSWIPRQLWADKPVVSFGKVFADTYMADWFYGTGVSASATIVGEGYLNFHLPGMLIVALGLGFALRVLYEWLVLRNRGAPGLFVYSALFYPMVTAWEAPLSGLAAFLVAYAVLLLGFVALLCRRRDAVGTP